MTHILRWAHLPHELLEKAFSRIITRITVFSRPTVPCNAYASSSGDRHDSPRRLGRGGTTRILADPVVKWDDHADVIAGGMMARYPVRPLL